MNISMRFWKLKKGWKVVPLNLCWCSKLPIIFTLQFLVLFNMIALRLPNIDKHIYALQISSDLNMIDDRLICCIRFSTFHILSHKSKSNQQFCVSLKSKSKLHDRNWFGSKHYWKTSNFHHHLSAVKFYLSFVLHTAPPSVAVKKDF